MRLHAAKVPQIAARMVESLLADGDIETTVPRDVQSDVEAILNQFVRDEQDITDKARDLLASRGLPNGQLGRIKKMLADDRGIKVGDEAIDYVLDQLVEMLLQTPTVEEIFVEDVDLRRKLRVPLREQVVLDEQIQAEVRGRLKHVQEGTSIWEVEYKRMMEDIKRRKGL
jgi:hypothetical protein